MNSSDDEITIKNTDFGSVLEVARKSKNYTIDDVCKQLKIPAHTITAIENNDVNALPAPTFTQGYIRTYAKFLEISEQEVLAIYNQAVPHEQAAELKPRSNLPGEANSQSPLIKVITSLLIITGLTMAVYGSYRYYQKKADVMETARESKQPGFTGNSIDSPGTVPLKIRQNARLTEDGELMVQASEPVAELAATATAEPTPAKADGVGRAGQKPVVSEVVENPDAVFVSDSTSPLVNKEAMHDVDVLKIYAAQGSWMQVRDAGNKRLLYDMIPKRGSKVLRGYAPFQISLGNAKTTSLMINGVAIDMSKYIRANNTAKFTVSTRQQKVVFH